MQAHAAEWSFNDAWQCQQLLTKLCLLLDHERMDELGSVFAAAPVMTVFGTKLTGLPDISARFLQLTQGIVIRHCLSPGFFEPFGGKARGHSYVTVFRAEGDQIPAPMQGASLMAEYVDIFVREPEGWRIELHDISMIFRKQ